MRFHRGGKSINMTKQVAKNKRGKKFVFLLTVLLLGIIGTLKAADMVQDQNVRYVPEYEKIDLRAYLAETGPPLSTEDYRILFQQTGLGRPAIDAMREVGGDLAEALIPYQDYFFEPLPWECEKIGIITYEERLYNEEGKITKGFLLADVREGDILISKSTHSVGWRHGHAGIVTDDQKGKTLEAMIWGTPSTMQRLSRWQSYPTMIQLRLKDKALGKELAVYAAEHMKGVDYGLLTGLFSKNTEEVNTTQCAHLPWYVYMQFGYDVDSDGGWLVTPKDVANARELEVVQVYGVDTESIWE